MDVFTLCDTYNSCGRSERRSMYICVALWINLSRTWPEWVEPRSQALKVHR
jgi:hypothetical protein